MSGHRVFTPARTTSLRQGRPVFLAEPNPFDRLIAGTALRLDAPLLTNDERMRKSGLVRTVW